MESQEDTRPLLIDEIEPLPQSHEEHPVYSLPQISSIGPPKVWTCTLILSISVAIIGGSFQFGFQTGCMANTKDVLNSTFNVSSITMSVIVSGMPIGGIFGGLLAGLIADKIGRKKCMLVNNVPILIGTALMAVAWNEYFFILGRIMLGFACGIATGVTTLYISEISPVSVKGGVGVSHQFMITFGILVGFVLSIHELLKSFPNYFRAYFAFPALPALYSLGLLAFCPESPTWLYYNKEREDLAREALTKLRNSRSQADKEVDDMIRERTAAKSSVMVSYSELFTNPTLRLSLVIGVALQGAQQLSGVNAILNYGPDIMKQAGLANADLATGLLGGINVLTTFISVPLMDRLGRRTLMIAGLSVMALSYVGVAVSETVHFYHPEVKWTSTVSIVTLLTFIIAFAVGPGSIPWLIVGDIFTSEARGKASSICVGANWFCNLIVVLTYDKLNTAMSPNTFFLYMGIVIFFLVFTLLFVPETRRKPVEQIREEISEQALKCPPTVY